MRLEKIARELDKIRVNGTVTPDAVVRAATPEDAPLHPLFQWDDEACGEEYRLWQARQLIVRIEMVVIPHTRGVIEPEIRIQKYVSLRSDRRAGKGYRVITEVMKSPMLKKELLQQAFEDFKAFERKYYLLMELVPVFEAMNAARGRQRKP